MPSPNTRTISLPEEQARTIDALVASGAYATAGEVVRAGLEALRERDAAGELWLWEDVAPVYDAMQAEPGRGIPADRVRADLDALHAERLRAGGRGTA